MLCNKGVVKTRLPLVVVGLGLPEHADKVETVHGPDYSYRCHSIVSGSFSDGRIWVGLPVAWRPRHSSHHHIDPVSARPLVERLFKVKKISRIRRARGVRSTPRESPAQLHLDVSALSTQLAPEVAAQSLN